jgi:hypothetical protein
MAWCSILKKAQVQILLYVLYKFTQSKGEGKGKGIGKSCPCDLTKHHSIKAYWRSGGIAPRIL